MTVKKTPTERLETRINGLIARECSIQEIVKETGETYNKIYATLRRKNNYARNSGLPDYMV